MHALRVAFSELCASASLSTALSPGQLTPAEFLASGDWLVGSTGGLWAWAGGDAECRSSAFPVGRQFLVCSLAVPPDGAACGGGGGVGGAAAAEEERAGYTLVEAAPAPAPAPAAAAATPAAAAAAAPATVTVMLLYDAWWRVPRCYVHSAALGPSGVLTRLVAADQGAATATLEPLPLHRGGGLCVSLHPCKHAATMAGLLQGKPPHLYCALLLKVLASSLPLLPIDSQHC